MGKVMCNKADNCTLLTNCAHAVPHVPRGNCHVLCGRCVPVKEEHKPKLMRCPDAGTKEKCKTCKHRENHSEGVICKCSGEYCPACEPVSEEPAPAQELKFGDTLWYNILDEEAHEGRYLGVVRSDPSRIWIFSEFYGRPIHRRKINTSTTPPKKKELWEDLEVGQPVVVRNSDTSVEVLKFFKEYNQKDRVPVRCHSGFSGDTTTVWRHFRLPTKGEMIKLGFDLNRWKFTEEAEQSLQDDARHFSQPSTRYQENKIRAR